jgi:hypothetical protein
VSHADTIRRSIMCSLYNTGRTIEGSPYSHDDYDAAHAALDALLAETQRLEGDRLEAIRLAKKTQRLRERAMAENQQLRDALEAAPDWPASDKEYGDWVLPMRRMLRTLAAVRVEERP